MTRKPRSHVRILTFRTWAIEHYITGALPGLKNAPVFIAHFIQCPEYNSGLIIFSRYITSLRGHVNSVYQVNSNNRNRAKLK